MNKGDAIFAVIAAIALCVQLVVLGVMLTLRPPASTTAQPAPAATCPGPMKPTHVYPSTRWEA